MTPKYAATTWNNWTKKSAFTFSHVEVLPRGDAMALECKDSPVPTMDTIFLLLFFYHNKFAKTSEWRQWSLPGVFNINFT